METTPREPRIILESEGNVEGDPEAGQQQCGGGADHNTFPG